MAHEKTQGQMPDEGDGQFGAAATQGKLAPQGKESFDGLQRDLEVEVVNHLRLQNAQLMEELDRLRALVSQKGSNSSWSELGGVSACAGIPPEGEHSGFRHEGYQTPRSAQQFEKGKREIRFTPNGTRIPDGSPPKEDNSVSCQGPEPPPVRPAVPPFPQSFLPDERMEKFLDGYERIEVIPKVLKSERIWGTWSRNVNS